MQQEGRALERGVAGAALLWAAVLPLAAAATGGQSGTVAQLGAAAVYVLGSVICHQQPERSFRLWGEVLPVCARCAGIYLGAALAAVPHLTTSGIRLRSGVRSGFRRTRTSRTCTSRTARWVLALGAMPALLTLVYEWTTGNVPSNAMRALTGIVLGAAAMRVILAGFAGPGTAERDAVN